jgi:excisionase family DNA binding protein
VSEQGGSAAARGHDGSEKRPSGRLLTAGDLAERWQVPTSHVYRLARGGRLPFVALGRYKRFSLAAVEEFEAAGGAAADA